MAIQIINTGTSANAGNGDSIRTAFNKVNNNFDFLNGIVVGTSTNFNSGVRDVVKPMLIHDAHRGLTAAYSTLNDRIILTVSEVAESTFNNIRVLNTATLRDVVMTGTVTMGFIQGFDDVNIIKYADDGSLNFRMKNTYGIGSSEINLLDDRVGSFNIVHQNSGANNEFLSAGQNYIYDDRGRAINIGRGGNINFYSDQNWEGYTVPALSISNTGTVVVNSALNITNDNFKLGGNQVSVVGNTILINGIETTGITDHLTAGEFTATLTTAGNLILPGNARLEYGSFVQPGQTVTNYGATFSSDGPFSGAGSIYFDGSSRVEVAGGSHFDLNTGTYTIEWFQKPTAITTGSEYTVFILGTLDDQTLQAFNTYEFDTIVTSAVLEGNYELSAPYITDFLNTWSHVAIVKKPDIYSVFINGVQTFTTATYLWPTPVTATSNLVIGAAELYSEYQNTFTGYISNMRWEAREVYTATFVPPTSILTATSNTRLLLAAEDSNNYLWDTAGIVLETPQALTIAVGTSSLILNQYGMLTLDQQGAYNQLTVPGTLFRIDTDQPNYTQMTLHNINSNITATSDLIFVRDNGDVELGTGFLDIGINSSNYVEEEMFGIHGAGSAYMFTNDADLVIGTQNPGKRLIFHAGGSTALDSAGYVDDYTWQFNRSVQTIFGTPGPLNFTIQNTSNNSAAQAVYQARNDLGAYVHFGINSSNPVAFYGNIGPGESFFHNHNTTATLSIGSEGNLVFYSNEVDGFSGTATLTMSRVDRSSTFGGHVLPDADLAYDLGSSSTQWRSLYVGTSTVYFGGIPLRITNEGGITVNDIPVAGTGTVQPYLELTDTPFITQPVTLGTDTTITASMRGIDALVDVVIGEGSVIDSITVTTPGLLYVVGQRYRLNYWQVGGNDDADNIDFEVATVGSTGTLLTVANAAFEGTATNTPGTYSNTSIEYRPTEFDEVDTGLTLTRGLYGGLFNSEEEFSYNSSVSPIGTLWNADGWDTLVGFNTRTYDTFDSILTGPDNTPSPELIMWDTINDKYYKFAINIWGIDNNEYSYTRTLITDPNYFSKTNNGNEVDVIVEDDGNGAGIGITRDNNNGIYNPYRDEGWSSSVSPSGTLWNIDGWNDLTDIESRTYTNFYAAYGNGQLGNRVPGSKAIMYVSETDKYYAIDWIGWTQGINGNPQGGGFSYTRREIDLTKLTQGITFADGTVQTTAYIPTNVVSTAPGLRRIETASGYKQVAVTARVTDNYTGAVSQTTNGYELRVARTSELDAVIIPLNDGDLNVLYTLSFDNVTFREVWLSSVQQNEYWFYYQNDLGQTTPQTEDDPVYLTVTTGGDSVAWWSKNELPGGADNFRGAVIDYHAYTGDGTIIGTIHIVDDDGEDYITHTEVSSGSTDSMNNDLWIVTTEGTIRYGRFDGEASTLKIHWTAKVFYGDELYD